MNELLLVVLFSLASIIVLFVLTKIMGSRQMSEMSMFDYIVSITIGSIAAEMAINIDKNILHPTIAMAVYALTAAALSLLCNYSMKIRRLVSGTPLILFEKNTLYKSNMKKAKIDLCELLGQCRISGYFDLNELEMIILEANGKMSFLPKSDEKPVSPSDLSLKTEQKEPAVILIMDGQVLKGNLKHFGKDEIWLKRKLHALGYKEYKDVFLASADQNNKLSVYPSNADHPKKYKIS